MGAHCLELCPHAVGYRRDAADLPVEQFDAGLCFLEGLAATCPDPTKSINPPSNETECHSLDQPMMREVAEFVISHARK